MQPNSPPPPAIPAATPPLYSIRAIQVFSVFFSAIAGGALMAQNLRDVGQPRAARVALWSSIGGTLGLLWLTSYLPDSVGSGTWMPLALGLAGAAGLEAYFRKFVANRDDFPAKSIRKALVICLLITVPLVAFVIYTLLQVG